MKYIYIVLILSINLNAQNKSISIPNTRLNSNTTIRDTSQDITLINDYKIQIMNYIEEEKYDSLILFIKYCDSSVISSSKWLDRKERFFIELFAGNIEFISNAKNYKNYLGLRDTIDYYLPDVYKLLYHEPNIIDSSSTSLKINLLDYLLVSFRKRIKTLKEKYYGYEYVWDFLNFIYDEKMKSYDYLNRKSYEYYIHYPNSPLLNFVRYNYIYKEKLSKRGVKFGLGYGWFGFDNKSMNLFKPRGNLSIWIDTYWYGIHVAFAMYRGYSLQTNSDILVDNKILPKGSKLYQGMESLTTGYLIRLNPDFEITPHAGIVYTETQSDDINLKPIFGLQAGIKTDYVIESHKESELFIGGNLMLRCEFGIISNNYGKIRKDLGGYSYYVSVGILFSAYRTFYDYSFYE